MKIQLALLEEVLNAFSLCRCLCCVVYYMNIKKNWRVIIPHVANTQFSEKVGKICRAFLVTCAKIKKKIEKSRLTKLLV